MLYLVPTATSLAPLLHQGLQKIARTPRARLQIGYHLVPRYGCRVAPLDCTCGRPPFLASTARAEVVRSLERAKNIPLPAGAANLVERIVAGGIDGEFLPLANLECEANQCVLINRTCQLDLIA